ncbi:hypothetical protein K2173_026132 [Erythroxylum novogranatense]|uniref:Uncharacterized protein n=1 Tax=Erythroxylum novogranatense TaxID=1862640 RepID=A0AAV8TYW1_9ROSI|nr:hypothetical protein K2173_026132 [Erythroxylum novogranatense]
MKGALFFGGGCRFLWRRRNRCHHRICRERFNEPQQEKVTWFENLVKIREATLYALASLSEQLLEREVLDIKY